MNEDTLILRSMCRTLEHRGPDDEGYYEDASAHLGMRRLSIIDLESGQQPMSNEDDSLWLVFNGELYNYRELRSLLIQNGHIFRTNSDTEVILHAYEEFGEACLQHFNGMFAFAIWDKRRQRLFLARDRLGIKPLYYWSDNSSIVFASELKALLQHPGVPTRLNLAAVDLFLTLEYIPAPHTIFENVCKLPPGYFLTFEDGQLRVQEYWDISFDGPATSPADYAERLAELIEDAVRLQMVSDVPIGAFLSGGIDSSTVVSFMSACSREPVHTFSIGFEDKTYNEVVFARTMARHAGAVHREEILYPDIAELAERLIKHLDEPFADVSVFPTYLVSQLARESVKVILSGDGGDEIFGGYDTYVAQYLDRYYRLLPRKLRQQVLPAAFSAIPPQPAKKGLINRAKRFVEGASLPSELQHTRWMLFLTHDEREKLYQSDVQASLNGHRPTTVLEQYFQRVQDQDALAQQQYTDIKTYLADDILTKVDRMSMAASLEVRVPLLDHRIVEFALNLPPQLKLNGTQTKVILRQAMQGRIPDQILNRSKQGFSIPLKNWLRGPLRPMLTDLLSYDSIRREGMFEPQVVHDWVAEHLEARANHSHKLWALMVFELWRRNFG